MAISVTSCLTGSGGGCELLLLMLFTDAFDASDMDCCETTELERLDDASL